MTSNAASPLTPLPPNQVLDCFGCGVHNPHGLKMTFATDGSALYSTVTIPAHLGGWSNLVHGGVLSTICDEIMGWAVMHFLQKMALTRTMTVEFLKPMFVTDTITAVGRIVEEVDDYRAIASGELSNEKGELCVRAKGEFALLSPDIGIRMGILGEKDAERFFSSIARSSPNLPGKG